MVAVLKEIVLNVWSHEVILGELPPVLGSVRIRIGLSEDPPGQDLAIYLSADPRFAWKLNFDLSPFSLSHFNLFYLIEK